jgi:hypothetical protein
MVMMKGLTGDRWKNVRDSFERFGIFLYDSIGQKWLESLKWGMCQPAAKAFPPCAVSALVDAGAFGDL